MNILLLGSGGREHALAWKLSESKLCSQLFIGPGNAGTAQFGTNMPFTVNDFDAISKCCKDQQINMVIVGPEEPLVNGIVDFLQTEFPELMIIGPSKDAAQLEGSKDFSKQFMQKHNIPTAAYKTFTKDTLQDGLTYLATAGLPVV